MRYEILKELIDYCKLIITYNSNNNTAYYYYFKHRYAMKISEKDMKNEYDNMIKAFDSPYLVKIVKDSYIEHKKYYCFVMEYYKNGSLRNLIV
jgi:hypothetical protein